MPARWKFSQKQRISNSPVYYIAWTVNYHSFCTLYSKYKLFKYMELVRLGRSSIYGKETLYFKLSTALWPYPTMLKKIHEMVSCQQWKTSGNTCSQRGSKWNDFYSFESCHHGWEEGIWCGKHINSVYYCLGLPLEMSIQFHLQRVEFQPNKALLLSLTDKQMSTIF